VDCNEVGERLLEAAEGVLSADDETAVEAHLARCAKCRAEFGELRRGVDGLRGSVPVLAPRERYLTHARMDQVLGGEGPRIFQLATYRQFVAAAAAAAIVVSAAFIGARFLGARDARRLMDTRPVAVRTDPPMRRLPVMVEPPGQGQPITVAHSVLTPAPIPAQFGSQAVLRTDTPGVTVPVNHALYDPEESSHWW
jgi:hypothetical protein